MQRDTMDGGNHSSSSSVPKLIDALCTKLCENIHGISGIKKKKIIKNMRSLAYKTLLKQSHEVIEDYDESERDELIALLIDKTILQRNNKRDEKITKVLKEKIKSFSDLMDLNPSLRNVLIFLLCMARDKQNQPSSCVWDLFNKNFSLQTFSVTNSSWFCSENSLNYGNREYSQYNSSLFDAGPFMHDNNNPMPKLSNMFPFESVPGCGLSLFEKFSQVGSTQQQQHDKNYGLFEDEFSINSQQQNRFRFSLNVPELNSKAKLPHSLTIPSLRSSHLDEGYVTPEKELLDIDQDKNSVMSATGRNAKKKRKTFVNVWNNVTTESLMKPPLRWTWESLGQSEHNKEPPFFSESNADAIEEWKKYVASTIKDELLTDSCEGSPENETDNHTEISDVARVEPNSESHLPPLCTTMSVKQFFRDVKFLLIGIDSKTFHFNELTNSFVIRKGTSVPGLTPECLDNYSAYLIDCANNFRTLNNLITKAGVTSNITLNPSTNITPKSNNSAGCNTVDGVNGTCGFVDSAVNTTVDCNSTSKVVVANCKGLVFQAMCSSVSNWLKLYRGFVIKITPTETASSSFLDLKSWLHPLQLQLRFLVGLCCPVPPQPPLPLGGELLSYVYNVVQVTASKQFSSVLYNVLESCSRVYFGFLERWLFEGICDDPYEEFFIELRCNYEPALDRSYWRKTFVLKEDKIPAFLSDLAGDIFVCGKTLNLVKLCNPCEPLCIYLKKIYPKIQPCLEEDSLRNLEIQCNNFIAYCADECGDLQLTGATILDNCDPESISEDRQSIRNNEAIAAAKQSAESLARIKGAKEEEKKTKENEKRKIFETAKREMLEAAERKKEQRRKEVEEDRQRMEKAVRRADVERNQLDIEKKKLVAHYRALLDAADCRRMKTEWKAKRLKLTSKRDEFLMEDENSVSKELLNLKCSDMDHVIQKNLQTKGQILEVVADNEMQLSDNNTKHVTIDDLNNKHIDLSCNVISPRAKDVGRNVVGHVQTKVVQPVNSLSSCDSYATCPSHSESHLSSNTYHTALNYRTIISRTNSCLSLPGVINESAEESNSNNSEEKIINLNMRKSSSDTDIHFTTSGDKNIKDDEGDNKLQMKAQDVKKEGSISVASENIKCETLSENVDDFKVAKLVPIDNNFHNPMIEGPNRKSQISENVEKPIDKKENKLNKLFTGVRKEALRNKQKVYKDEYGIDVYSKVKLSNKSDKSLSFVESWSEDIYSECKDKVLEQKLKNNEEVIKERQHELELACCNVVNTRKEAARNKARVMSGEYSVVIGDEGVTYEDQVGTRLVVPKEKATSKSNTGIQNFEAASGVVVSNEKPSTSSCTNSGNFDTISEIATKDDNHDNVAGSKNNNEDISDNVSESISTDKNTHQMPHNAVNHDYFDSEGCLILNKLPLVVDIFDKIKRSNINKHCEKSENKNSEANSTTIYYCLYKSVLLPTQIQKMLTNNAVLRLFLINEKLLDHLQCVRKHFFLLDGEFGRILTDSLFSDLEIAEHPSVLLSHLRLNAILRSASNRSISVHNETDATAVVTERLSFGIKEIPLAFPLTDPDVLSCLSMKYRTHWPLNIILTDEAIFNYDKIFAFQLRLQRATWVLQEDIHLLKLKNMKKSSHFRQLQIFRHAMTQFVRALSNYVIAVALEESWIKFKNDLTKVDTLDSLYAAHVSYVKMTLFRCLLNKRSQPLQDTIKDLLRTILTFHELLRNGEWVYDEETSDHKHSSYSRLVHQYTSFEKVSKYIIKYLGQLVYRGYQPHLDMLVNFLSANDFYLK